MLGVIQDNTTAGDWSNNLFAGVVYYLLGDKDEGIACVEANVDFGYESAVRKTILKGVDNLERKSVGKKKFMRAGFLFRLSCLG